MDVSSVTGSLSEELSVRQIFKHVEKCARGSYRTLGICFSLSSEQTCLSTPLFDFSVFIFSLSTAPRPWPLRSSRLWGCLHVNSRGSGFTKRTIFGEGILSRKKNFFLPIMQMHHTESKPVLHGSVCGDWLRCLPLSLCPVCCPNRLVYLCLAGQKEKCALFKSNAETIGNCQPCDCGFKACSL